MYHSVPERVPRIPKKKEKKNGVGSPNSRAWDPGTVVLVVDLPSQHLETCDVRVEGFRFGKGGV